MFLRLCVRAPRMLIRWPRAACRYLPSELVFKVSGAARETRHDRAPTAWRPLPGLGRSAGATLIVLLQTDVRRSYALASKSSGLHATAAWDAKPAVSARPTWP